MYIYKDVKSNKLLELNNKLITFIAAYYTSNSFPVCYLLIASLQFLKTGLPKKKKNHSLDLLSIYVETFTFKI